MRKLIIYNKNIPFQDSYNKKDLFEFNYNQNESLDEYIHNKVIEKIDFKDLDVIYIKDNLSSNYLELHGIILAYHIRLSKELKEKRFIPIVILSDTTRDILNKIDPIARILFTKNIYLIPNTTEAIKKFQKRKLETLKENEFNSHFLDLITVAPPENSTSHSIANEWAIKRWATLLSLNSSATEKNKAKISSMLYVKYLEYKLDLIEPTVPKEKDSKSLLNGKLLFIDDKGKDGWNDIVEKYLDLHYEGMEFKGFEESNFLDVPTIQREIKTTIEEYEPNIILLDLRLLKEDANKDEIEDITGIKILKAIKELNPSIQIIMFSASNDSSILDNIRDEGVLGYVKKDAPNDKYKSSNGGFEKLGKLIERGIKRKYLGEIYQIQKEITASSIIFENILTIKNREIENKKLRFKKKLTLTKNEEKINELEKSIEMVFEILNSNMAKNLIYAMLSIFKSIEYINNLFTYETSYPFNTHWIDSKKEACTGTSPKNKILKILEEKLSIVDMNNNIDEITCFRNYNSHASEIKYKCEKYLLRDKNEIRELNGNDIIKWFKLLQIIISKIDKIP